MRPTALSALPPLLCLVLLGACSDGPDSRFDAAGGPAEVYDDCNLHPDSIEINVTAASLEFVRTPDACFEFLDGYDFDPNYADIDGLRMHYVDEGPRDGEVILMLHGQPSWSYLYRKMIPGLVEAGYRVVAPDHIGMGRSDKPVDPRVHQYEQHVAWMKVFIDELELSGVTLFGQDWGSLIGLRVAGDMMDRFARIVLANGDLPIIPPGANPFTVPVFEIDDSLGTAAEFFASRSRDRIEGFQQWIDYAASAPGLFAGDVVELGTRVDLTPEQHAAYDAPYPSEIYRAAIRAFPSMVAGIEDQNLPAWNALGRFDRPFLALAGELDPNLGSEATQNKWIEHVPGAIGQEHRRYNAGHFIQEDVGEELAAQVVAFMRANPIPASGPLFNVRYCEVLLAFPEDGRIRARVYGTQGINLCPQALWEDLDPEAIAQEYAALAAIMNGPRFWVLDAIAPGAGGSSALPGGGESVFFGDLEMQFLTTVLVPAAGANEDSAYGVARVDRDTVFHYVAGRRVYELQDPQGRRYIMQSFSRIVDTDLQLHDLASLGKRLVLPPGWRFSTRILQEPLRVPTVEGVAEVVRDDLTNTYQLLP